MTSGIRLDLGVLGVFLDLLAGAESSIWEAAGCPGSLELSPPCKSCQSAPCTSSAPPAASASWLDLWDDKGL